MPTCGLLVFVRRGEDVQPVDLDPSWTVHELLKEVTDLGLLQDGERLAIGKDTLHPDDPIADTGICSECTLTVLGHSVGLVALVHSDKVEATVCPKKCRLELRVLQTPARVWQPRLWDSLPRLQLVGPPVDARSRERWVVVMESDAGEGSLIGLTSADEATLARRSEGAALRDVLGTIRRPPPEYSQVISAVLCDGHKVGGRHMKVLESRDRSDGGIRAGAAVVVTKTIGKDSSVRVGFEVHRAGSYDLQQLQSWRGETRRPERRFVAELAGARCSLHLVLAPTRQEDRWSVYASI